MSREDNYRPASILSSWSDETIVHKPPACSTNRDLVVSQPCFIVKRLYRKQSESHQQFVKRSSGEYCIASVLSHINVVGALNLLMEDYSFCMVMNLVEMGDPLSIIIKSNHLPIVTIISYFKQLAQAANYIQNLGIAHRNIQPNNILIFSGGCLKLTGFGDAFVFRSPLQNHHLKSQGKVGCLAYQPPEVLPCNEYIDLGYCASAADIWSMGVVTLHMIQGHQSWSMPCQYHDPDYARFVTHHQHKTSCAILSLPPPLRCLIYRILDPNPSSRIDIQQLIANL
ncbi:kinase-like domain-containing protein [Absidia repens]|uniref:Kinase-like domain-containing protein n=1 Tax=Absidia repens TaxID=90262 RepID=A0A1X2IZN3_9FUNG|nr:kinase-like domain-containing protein [Absidia repens]